MKSRVKRNNKEIMHARLARAIQNCSLRVATSDQPETLYPIVGRNITGVGSGKIQMIYK